MLLNSGSVLAFVVEEDVPASVDMESMPVPALSEIIDEELFNSEDQFYTALQIEELIDGVVEYLWDGDLFYYLESCEQTYSQATLEDNFEDNAVIVVLDRAKSRTTSLENRSFMAGDFSDVGAVDVRDIDRLSDRETAFAEQVWEAERRVEVLDYVLDMRNINSRMYEALSLEMEESVHRYEIAQQAGTDNTLVSFDQFRRILLIRLNQNCRENVLRVIEQLQYRDYIYWVGPSFIYEPPDYMSEPLAIIPSTGNFLNQWSVDKIDAPHAWGITTGSSAIRVGILGQGIYGDHPELAGRVSALPCGRLQEIDARTWYGTGRAGIIGASGYNGVGIAGVAWNVELVSVGVDDSVDAAGNRIPGHIYGIYNARDAGIPILLHSFHLNPVATGGPLYNAIRNSPGLLYVVVAGNILFNHNDSPGFRIMAALPNVIIVGASTRYDTRWINSGYGSEVVHLFAPTGVVTTTPMHLRDHVLGYGYRVYGGTSAAAPHVAGVAALIMSINPDLTPYEVRDIILRNVDGVSE